MDVITIQQLHQDPALRNRVARRAYELFIQRGRQMGKEAEDWFRAEEEILQEVIGEQRVARGVTPELENQNQEQLSNTSITGEAQALIAQENSDTESATKKRTYTRRKKADTPVVEQEAKVENVVMPVTISETPAKTSARRPRSKTSVA